MGTGGIRGVNYKDLTANPPHPVESLFELAALRMADAWRDAGRVEVTTADLRIAREFLERSGVSVFEKIGGVVHLVRRDGRTHETTREGMMLIAFRYLAEKARRIGASTPVPWRQPVEERPPIRHVAPSRTAAVASLAEWPASRSRAVPEALPGTLASSDRARRVCG